MGNLQTLLFFSGMKTLHFRSNTLRLRDCPVDFPCTPPNLFSALLSLLCATGLTHRSPQGLHQWTPCPPACSCVQHMKNIGRRQEKEVNEFQMFPSFSLQRSQFLPIHPLHSVCSFQEGYAFQAGGWPWPCPAQPYWSPRQEEN